MYKLIRRTFCLFLLKKKNPSKFLVEQQVKCNKQRAKSSEQRAKSNEQRAKTNEQRAKSNEQQAKTNEQRTKTNEQRAKSNSNKQKVTSNDQRATSKKFSLYVTMVAFQNYTFLEWCNVASVLISHCLQSTNAVHNNFERNEDNNYHFKCLY